MPPVRSSGHVQGFAVWFSAYPGTPQNSTPPAIPSSHRIDSRTASVIDPEGYPELQTQAEGFRRFGALQPQVRAAARKVLIL